MNTKEQGKLSSHFRLEEKTLTSVEKDIFLLSSSLPTICTQKESFILEVVSKEVREFLSWFTETQMFEVFISNHVEKLDYGTSGMSSSYIIFMKQGRLEH